MNGDSAKPPAAQALDPVNSVVVAACAGSGKTWLLVSRILRLLLAGVAPGEILAITFTRAAAQEMAARLREWLQFLAGVDDDAARRFLRERSVEDDEMPAALSRARSLHEQVLTAQPGITITTFHSWYLQLLRNAPLGAGALGSLTLSEQTAALIDEAWELFAESCRRAPHGAAATGLDAMLRDYGLASTRKLLSSFLHHRADWWAYAGREADAADRAVREMQTALDVDCDTDLVSQAFGTGTLAAEANAFAALLEKNGGREQSLGQALTAALDGGDAGGMLDALQAALFTTKGERRVRKSTKAQQIRLGADGEAALLRHHATLGEQVERLRRRLVDQCSVRMHAHALPAAIGLLDAYQQLKRDRQIVDFADVEWLAYDLLTRDDQAIALQFKLDARYRHILLDEFQDTNPLQWLALEAWFEASVAAASSSAVFLVGDPKQAIYRFRRAEAKLFDAAREWLVRERRAVVLEQDESRRCAPAVLDVVNRVFVDDAALSGDFRPHVAHDRAVPGRVEVLPLARRGDCDEGHATGLRALRNPLTSALIEEEDGRREAEASQLVSGIRHIVTNWIIEPDRPSGHARRATCADIMILVRSRTHLPVYERALRHAGIAFTTSRRGGLLDTLEVQDMLALLGFLVSPFDDLKLAHALRSPIFDCSDGDLMTLASAAGATWWMRLLGLSELAPESSLGRARTLLSRWLERADRLPVHDHLDKIFFEGDVERRYAAAVPPAVRDVVIANLHAFIERALDLDSGRYPSLPRFLDELKDMARVPAEEAPDEGGIDDGGNAVRILTVHGAKGLEAPIVWLLDAATAPPADRGYEALVDWPPAAARPRSFSFRTRRAEWNSRQAAHMQEEARSDQREDSNLLYVAMTRARQALLVSGCEPTRVSMSWYERIRAAVAAQAGSEDAAIDASLVWGADLVGIAAVGSAAATDEVAPAATSLSVPPTVPSGTRRDVAMSMGQRYGTAFHRLMECLAVDVGCDAERIASSFGLTPEDARLCATQARTLAADAAMRKFFDPQAFVRAFNELPLVDAAGELRRIDRVVEYEHEVWVIDYKTGALHGSEGTELEAAYRAQVAAYCRSMQAVHPDKTIRGALIFADGRMIEVAHRQ